MSDDWREDNLPTQRLALLLHTYGKHEGGLDELCVSIARGFAEEFSKFQLGNPPACKRYVRARVMKCFVHGDISNCPRPYRYGEVTR